MASAAAARAGARRAPKPGSTGGGARERRTSGPLWELGLGVAALRLPDYRGSDQSQRLSAAAAVRRLPRHDPARRSRRRACAAARHRARQGRRQRRRLGADAQPRQRARSRHGRPRADASRSGRTSTSTLCARPTAASRLDLRLPLRAAIAVQRSPQRDRHDLLAEPEPRLQARRAAAGISACSAARCSPIASTTRTTTASSRPTRRRSGRPTARRGGYAGWQALAATSRRFGRTWVGAFVRYDSLRGAVFESSPLVRRDQR